MAHMIPPAEALSLAQLVTPPPHGVASRVLVKTPAANVTMFAFDDGEGLTEHSSPYEAFVLVLDGHVTLTIGGTPVDATAGTMTRMPANVPHALDAVQPSRLLLLMLKDQPA